MGWRSCLREGSGFFKRSHDGSCEADMTRGFNDAGAPVVAEVGGTLAVSFMTNEEVRIPRIDGGDIKLVISVDGGRVWSSSGAARRRLRGR